MRARLQAESPILFVHTNGWNQSSTGQQILAGLGLQEGPTAATTGTRTGCHPAHPDAFGRTGRRLWPGPGAGAADRRR
ncbi:hypothetical protein ACPA9J_35350 [Pseudomonas aeruginosa]